MATSVPISGLSIGNRYSMSFISSPILGSTLIDAELIGITTFAMVEKLSPVATTHAQVAANNPSISPQPSAYKFLIFNKGGVISYISTGWIAEGSITEVQERYADIKVIIKDDEDINRLRNLLIKAGYSISSVALGVKWK